MFDYLILDIKKNVYNVKMSDFKELTAFQIVWFCSFLFAVLGMIFSPGSKFEFRICFYILAVVLLPIYLIYSKYDKYNRLDQLRGRYINRNIYGLTVLLKERKWNLYNEKGITWIIEQCDRELEKKSFFSQPNATFGKIVSFVLTLTLTFLVQIFNKDEIKTFLSTYGLKILYLVLVFFALFIGLGLIINGFLIGRKDIYRYVKADMEYLLLRVRA